jgi:hypothetical protein
VSATVVAITTTLVVAAPGGASTSPRPSIAFSKPPPSVVRIGQSVLIRGRAHDVPVGATAVLQSKGSTGWARLARRAVGRRGAVTVRWTVAKGTAIGPISLRLAVRRRGRVLAASRPAPSAIGSAYVPCSPPTPPPLIPRGDGWITGGVYGEGGPFPGMDACVSQRYTIEVLDSGGSVAARETVAGGHSYTLVVPSGNYTLKSAGCRGRATVRAGRQTRANTFCLYP